MRKYPRAYCLLRREPEFRFDAFALGLEVQGFDVVEGLPARLRAGDILVLWNRVGFHDRIAQRFEKAGLDVIVAENGWIGRDVRGGHLFALCKSQHNGAGRWRVGPAGRMADQGISLQGWRPRGKDILLLPQRGIGPPRVAMPGNWLRSVKRRLKRITDRPIRVREHPGSRKLDPSPDLEDCWAAVTWGSGAAIKAIAAGIPVFHDMPNWIGAPAARFGIDALEHPFLGDREEMFNRLSWAQWSIDEIATGEPFRWLLES